MAEKHFYEQRQFAERYLVPFLEEKIPDLQSKRVLEVGCAEAGLLDYLHQKGMSAVGIELESARLATAQKLSPNVRTYAGDITDETLLKTIPERFDLVIMRDVIEHIPNKKKALENIREFLNPGGYLFITFPPKYSPFAGHQQHARSFLKKTPYVSLLPGFLWYGLGRFLGESEEFLESVMRNHQNGLSIRAFERLYRECGYQAVVRELFLSRPILKFRMGLPTIRFPQIPFFREFLATGCEYILQKTA
ncbi:MAG: class I SAM-dependent methyltransferase [Calditrichia bacterium]